MFLIITAVVNQTCYSQKIFDLKIELGPAFTPQEIFFVYNNGLKDVSITDTFSRGQIEFKENFYSDYASFEVRCNYEGRIAYSGTFFINENPASILLYPDPQNPTGLKYKNAKNITPVFDTNSNQLFTKLLLYRKKEALAVDDFFARNGYWPYTNDSVKYMFSKTYKAFNERTISFLKDNSEDYFSFWYFINQVIKPSVVFFGKDSVYLKYLLANVQSNFPHKYGNSPGGKYITSYLEGLIRPYGKNDLAPSFAAKNTNGTTTSLNGFKGKYVLIDFWATWCSPCMAALQSVKRLKENYPSDKFEVIGISRDVDLTTLTNTISHKNINWINIWDEDDTITHLFGVTAIPTTILINEEGIIVYRCTGLTPDSEKEIESILKQNL
ncbi:MAG TPA: TlpA disulfide reductase family protein [Parafilimonas sp.]|nr:TlpA disulfide reductase family protein [Parafilimonas sp.]